MKNSRLIILSFMVSLFALQGNAQLTELAVKGLSTLQAGGSLSGALFSTVDALVLEEASKAPENAEIASKLQAANHYLMFSAQHRILTALVSLLPFVTTCYAKKENAKLHFGFGSIFAFGLSGLSGFEAKLAQMELSGTKYESIANNRLFAEAALFLVSWANLYLAV